MKKLIAKALQKHTKLKNEELLNLIEIPPNSELGDYAFPCFALAKEFKKSPREIAEILAKKIKSKDFEKIEAKGPYINFFISGPQLANETLSKILKERENYGKQKTTNKIIMVEFSQPNTHKAFHVGHVRGTSLGESISRILEFSGNKVIRANYQGDTGMHVAKWIWSYNKFHKDEKLKDDESWIANIYVDSIRELAQNPDYQEEVEKMNKKLEEQTDKKLNDLWKKTRKISLKAFDKIYAELGTKFDKFYFESEFENKAKMISKKLLKKKIAKISDGATIVNLEKYGLGVWVLLRKDGTVLYPAKDIALAEKKFKDYNLDESIYIIGAAQKLHFYQITKTLEIMKFQHQNKLKYVPVTEVRFPWGKMSSRTGENILYSNFKEELLEYATTELKARQSISDSELKRRALAITIASIKYSMIKQDTNKALIFKKEDALNFEGNTGPYLLYTYARAQSILRKANYRSSSKLSIRDIEISEKKLLLKLAYFPNVISKSNTMLAPNIIANYTFKLAKKFNEYYHTHKVIGTNEEKFRLSLVDAFSQVFKTSLILLGIKPLDEM